MEIQTLVHSAGNGHSSCNEYSEDCVAVVGCDMEAGVDGECTRYGAEGNVLCGDIWSVGVVCEIVGEGFKNEE